MKKKIKYLVFINLIIFLGTTTAFTQEESKPSLHSIFNINVGLPQFDVLENATTSAAISVGFNYCYFINSRLAIEGQANLSTLDYGRRGENEEGLRFLSYANLLVGTRYYLLEPQKYKHHIYTNLLVGVSAFEEIEAVLGTPVGETTTGQSLALSLEVCTVLYNRITFGISAEWLSNSILITPKLGFNLMRKKQKVSIKNGVASL
jgi:hypothetical protein